MAVKLPTFADVGFDDPRAAGGLPSFPQNDPGAAGLALFGKGVQDVGKAALDIAADQQNKQNQVNSALASADLDGNLFRTSEALKHERDPAKLDELKSQLPGFLDSAGATLTDPDARQMWVAKHRSKINAALRDVDAQHRKVYNDRFLAGAGQQLDEQSRLAAQTSDPAMREQAQRNIGDILGSLERAGIIGAAEGQKLGRDYGQKVIIGTVNWLDANKDPIGAGRYLRENLRHIDPDKAESLSRHLRPLEDREIGRAFVRGPRTGGVGMVPGGAIQGRISDPRGLVPFIREQAVANGIDPDVAVAVARSEGLAVFLGDGGKSGGAFQLYTGGGVGNRFQRDTGLDPLDPENEKQTIAYALKTAAKEGWGAWNGAKKIGITGFSGIGGARPEAPSEPPVATGGVAHPFDSVIGDSIARGVMGATKLAGDAQDGRTTQQVLDAITTTDPVLLKGKRVFLSSGASNSPDALGQVPQQLAALKQAGADVVLSGVGSGVKNYQAVNAKLAAYATAAGVPFSGEIPGTQGGRVHPRDYGPLAKQAAGMGAGESPAAAPAAAPPPGVPDIRAEADRIKAAKERGELSEEQADFAYREIQQEQQQTMLGHERAESDLTLAIARGEKGGADIEDAHQKGLISDTKRTQLQLHIIEEQKKQALRDQMILRVSSAGAGGAPLDPKSKDDRAGLDLHFAAVSKAWPADEVVDRSLAYSKQYGMVPTALQARIRGGLHSGRPELAVAAADTVSRLKNANPQLVAEIGDENDMRLATLISERTSAGVPGERAVQMAVEGMKAPKAVLEARDEEYEARAKTPSERRAVDTQWIEKQQNTLWVNDPNVDTMMRREFDEVTKTEFQKTGNLEASRRMALDNINRVWGRSSVGGNLRYMKDAPEKFYGVPALSQTENAAWMNEQLAADVAKGAFVDPANPITADRIKLLPDPTRAQDGAPVYQVWLAKDGGWQQVIKPDGAPISWKPDWASSEGFKRQQAEKQHLIDVARGLRSPTPAPEKFRDTDAGRLLEEVR